MAIDVLASHLPRFPVFLGLVPRTHTRWPSRLRANRSAAIQTAVVRGYGSSGQARGRRVGKAWITPDPRPQCFGTFTSVTGMASTGLDGGVSLPDRAAFTWAPCAALGAGREGMMTPDTRA